MYHQSLEDDSNAFGTYLDELAGPEPFADLVVNTVETDTDRALQAGGDEAESSEFLAHLDSGWRARSAVPPASTPQVDPAGEDPDDNNGVDFDALIGSSRSPQPLLGDKSLVIRVQNNNINFSGQEDLNSIASVQQNGCLNIGISTKSAQVHGGFSRQGQASDPDSTNHRQPFEQEAAPTSDRPLVQNDPQDVAPLQPNNDVKFSQFTIIVAHFGALLFDDGPAEHPFGAVEALFLSSDAGYFVWQCFSDATKMQHVERWTTQIKRASGAAQDALVLAVTQLAVAHGVQPEQYLARRQMHHHPLVGARMVIWDLFDTLLCAVGGGIWVVPTPIRDKLVKLLQDPYASNEIVAEAICLALIIEPTLPLGVSPTSEWADYISVVKKSVFMRLASWGTEQQRLRTACESSALNGNMNKASSGLSLSTIASTVQSAPKPATTPGPNKAPHFDSGTVQVGNRLFHRQLQ